MFKELDLRDWLKQCALLNPGRVFTAGQCAREIGMSVNTAKKYLRKFASEGTFLETNQYELSNGIVATYYTFNQEDCPHVETITKSWIASGDIISTQYVCCGCGKIVRWTDQQNYYAGWVGASDVITERI